MNLVFNNLQLLICHKTKPTDAVDPQQPASNTLKIKTGSWFVFHWTNW